MCVSPSYIHDPTNGGTYVACRNCWQCKANTVNDYVGRCIAEQQYATKTYAVTLTYRDDEGENTSVLVYDDFIRFMKRLRRKYDVRYYVAGEYGTKSGRAHWHTVLFFHGEYPEVDLETRFDWKFWPHGFSYFQQINYHGFHYVMKYVLKDEDQRGYQNHFQMSKKPLLGYRFICDLAQRYVDAGKVPHTPEYSFDHVRDNKGKRRTFWLQGRARELFAEEYLRRWGEAQQREHPTSGFIDEYYHRIRQDYIKDNPHLFSPEPRYERQKAFPWRPVIRTRSGSGCKIGEGWNYTGTLMGVPGSKWIEWKDGTISIYNDKEQEYWHVDDPVTVAHLRLRAADRKRGQYQPAIDVPSHLLNSDVLLGQGL